jgi:hypothetical protein
VTTTDDGIDQTIVVGTDAGTFEYSTIANDGDEAETTTSVLGNDVTHEIGNPTGEDHVDGTVTDDGTNTNDEAGMATTAVDGTD